MEAWKGRAGTGKLHNRQYRIEHMDDALRLAGTSELQVDANAVAQIAEQVTNVGLRDGQRSAGQRAARPPLQPVDRVIEQ